MTAHVDGVGWLTAVSLLCWNTTIDPAEQQPFGGDLTAEAATAY